MKSIHIIKSVFICLLLVSHVNAAKTTDHQMERFTKTVGINQPTTIKVINRYGDIRIRKADDNQFIYHGVAQSQDGQDVTLEFEQNKDSITAIVVYSKPAETSHLDRFDLALIVPPLVTLDIEIEKGKLTTKGLDSAIKVTTEGSDIQVKTSGPAELFSKRGSVDLSVKASTQQIKSNIQTHEGFVNVTYYKDMPYFEISTGSYVTSNSVPLLESLSQSARTFFYGDSKNNHHLNIKTDTGQIRLIDSAQ
jgi:hypothetical protein